MMSDDGGASWRISAPIKHAQYPNEVQAVEIAPNKVEGYSVAHLLKFVEQVWLNSRGLFVSRLGALSSDGGDTWGEMSVIPNLIQPLEGCEVCTPEKHTRTHAPIPLTSHTSTRD